MAVVVLGLAFIEQAIAGRFYAAGRNDLERATISALLLEAHGSGWIADDELTNLNRVRLLRNPVTHFRAPLSVDTIESRAVRAAAVPYSVLESDAKTVMEAVFHLLSKNTV
jgi:hypothetical protein